MGDFKSDRRGGSRGGFGGSRGGFGGRRSFNGGRSFGGNRDGGRGRSFGGDRERPEMHDVVCDKCGKNCQVPFRPTGDKPVLCSDCFRQGDGGNSRGRFSPRGSDKPSQTGISQEQFSQLNAKLDKILVLLENLELVDDSDDELEEIEKEDSQAD